MTGIFNKGVPLMGMQMERSSSTSRRESLPVATSTAMQINASDKIRH